MSKEKERLITGLKDDNSTETVSVIVRRPNGKDLKEAQIEYNKAMRSALENRTLLRQKLNDYLVDQGIWNKEKQSQYDNFIREINNRELVLKKGGIPLKKAKIIALELKRLRVDFRDLISERSSYDNTTAEGLADNARFDSLVATCTEDPNTRARVFTSIEDYNIKSSEPWAVKAASELASMIYNLDPDYEDNLPENKFLKSYKFVDAEGRLVNKDGHLIAVDENGVERLIEAETNKYIAYVDGAKIYVDRDGKPIEEIVFSPFTDDDGSTLDEGGEVLEKSDSTNEETSKKTKKKKSDPTE
jgi:hypothetical protein